MGQSTLKQTVPQAPTFLPVSRQRDRHLIQCPVPRSFSFHEPGPFTTHRHHVALLKAFYSPASVFAHGGEDGSCFAGLLGFVCRRGFRESARVRFSAPLLSGKKLSSRFLAYPFLARDNERENIQLDISRSDYENRITLLGGKKKKFRRAITESPANLAGERRCARKNLGKVDGLA